MKKQEYVPTRSFDRFSDISIGVLKEYGIRCVISDIDDTLCPHNDPYPTEEVINWVNGLKNEGISVCLISNNSRKRVTGYAVPLGVNCCWRAFKPSPKKILRSISDMQSSPDETVLIGDQLFTDIKAAYNAGIKSFLVTPISDKAPLFVKFKRLLERKLR